MPTVIRRALTFNFQQAITVTSTGQQIGTVEVDVIPLADPSNAAAIATYVGGLATQTVELANENNPVVFYLVPSNAPGLTETINYRAMWREGGVTGRTFTEDFAMPDQDINYEDLADLGNIITGTAYLQQSDLGVAGRVCKLNDAGEPVDAFGNPVPGDVDITNLQNQITAEVIARQAADSQGQTIVENLLEVQINSVISLAQTNLNAATASLTLAVTGETTRAEAAEVALTSSVATLSSAITANAAALTTYTASNTAALTHKADLDINGWVPVDQINPAAITHWYQVASQPAMLALTYPGQVQPGDVAILANGLVWTLVGTDPSNIADWVQVTAVTSVNSYAGNVVLAAADVGAIALGASITQGQVTGLSTALGLKANEADLVTLSGTVAAILADTTYVHTSGGVIPHILNDSSMAYVNNLNQITKKDGTLLAGGAGSGILSVNGNTGPVVVLAAADVGAIAVGGPVAQAQVTGLAATVAGLVQVSDPRLTNARPPTPHASTHGTAGSDPITIVQSQVTGLAALISGNQLATNTNAVNRISALETLVVGLGGGPGGSPAQTEFWTDATTNADVTDFSTVVLHSPFGIYASGPNVGRSYYNYGGVPSTDVAFPVVSPGGHLQLRVWNESNPADPTFALQADLLTLSGNVTTISTIVASKAAQTDMVTAQTNITTLQSGKADLDGMGHVPLAELPNIPQSQITGLSATLAGYATLTAGVLTAAQIPTGIPQASVSGLVAALAALCPLVSGTVPLANLPTNIPTSSIVGLSTTLTAKADLVAGTVPLSEMPQNIPESYVAGLVTDLGNKADLVAGVLKSNQIPTGIPQASVSGLPAALAAKGDLDGGFLRFSEFPFAALPHTVVVASQAAMLALTTGQVHVGDQCTISTTSAQGTYTLMALPASTLGNWQLQYSVAPIVTSVNTFTGAVNLQASDVGALATNASIPQSQITGLPALLASLATSAALATGIAGVTTPTQVQNMLSTSQTTRARVDYVATAAVSSTSGQQPVDGVVVPLNSVVLLKAQASSIQNGPWVVNSGPWTRSPDMATGTYFVKDTIFFVASGTAWANTIWQETSASGVVDANAQNYSQIGSCAPSPVFTAATAGGLSVTANAFSVVAATETSSPSTGGIVVSSSGVGVDFTRVTAKAVGLPVAASVTPTIVHNLNTIYPTSVTVIDTFSGNMRLIPWAVLSANSIQLGFNSAPTSGQYVCNVAG